jgi:hypothetical protein
MNLRGQIISIQGDSYSFIKGSIVSIVSPKALDNKILSHTSKIGTNYHISVFSLLVNAITC